MQETLAEALGLILDSEKGFSNHPADPGGPTNLGITQAVLTAWRGRPATVIDVMNLTRTEAEAIFTKRYAAPVQYAELPRGVDYCVLDMAVNSGPNAAGKTLQRVLGFTGRMVDGDIGSITLAAVAKVGAEALIPAFCEARLAYVSKLVNFNVFGGGWKARIARVENDALHMARGGVALMGQVALSVDAQAKATGPVRLLASPSGVASVAGVLTTIGAVAANAVDAATQAQTVLQPYAEVSGIRWILMGLAVVIALGGLGVAFTRTQAGATT